MHDQPHSVFVVGSANLDTYLSVKNFVAEGETIHAQAVTEDIGGKGLNQAIASARTAHVADTAGTASTAHPAAATVFIGAIGTDSAGEKILTQCANEPNLDMSSLNHISGVPTGQAIIQVSEQGNNAIVIVAGANGQLQLNQVTTALASARPGDVLVCQNEIPKPVTLAALAQAKKQGVYTILNLAPGASDTDFLSHVDLLIVNKSEATLLLGQEHPHPAAEIYRRFSTNTVVTLGEAGAVIATANYRGHAEALLIEVADTTGAGDAFVGAFATLIAEGATEATATAYGIAAATAACTASGAQNYRQRRPEFDALASTVMIAATD